MNAFPKRAVVSTINDVHYMGGDEADVSQEVLPDIQNSSHLKGDLWNSATLRRNITRLCVTRLHHQINEQLLLQYFYEGLLMMDWNMIDATSRGVAARIKFLFHYATLSPILGALMDKTPTTARHLISNMTGNMVQGGVTSRVVSEVSTFDNLRLENQLTKSTFLVRQLFVGQHQQAMQRI
ncbi:hypothetical protein CR513_37873, partial [Mucuna pruriens]